VESACSLAVRVTKGATGADSAAGPADPVGEGAAQGADVLPDAAGMTVLFAGRLISTHILNGSCA
jgi:hypothetical protein